MYLSPKDIRKAPFFKVLFEFIIVGAF